MIPPFVNTGLSILLVGVLVFNLSQRSHIHHGEAKRFATLHIAVLILFLYAAEIAVRRWALSPLVFAAAVAIAVAAAYLLRGKIFIFRRRCAECGAGLPLSTTLYADDNLCERCRSGKEWPYESSERMDPNSVPSSVDEVEWDNWSPSETAVICYVISDGHVLLINKKTGLGKGKVNAPGGRLEDGETPREAAVRELEEEVGITPGDIREMGHLSFIFTNGYSLRGTVFFAHSYTGEPKETEEADPFWIPIADIPYGNMWEDDRIWLPKALAGYHIEGKFIFEDEKMLSKRVDTCFLEDAAPIH